MYGGGGIMPDYFVPIDTSRYTDMHRSLIASGVVNKFVMNYIDKNRTNLQDQYKNFASYQSHFNVNDAMLKDLLELFKKEDFEMIGRNTASTSEEEFVVPEDLDTKISIVDSKNKRRTSAKLTAADMQQFEKSKSLIKLQIKALIARDLWNMSEYYQIINDENDALKKAIEIIENSKEYDKLLGK